MDSWNIGEKNADGGFESDSVHHDRVEWRVDEGHLFALAGKNITPLDDNDGNEVGSLGVLEGLSRVTDDDVLLTNWARNITIVEINVLCIGGGVGKINFWVIISDKTILGFIKCVITVVLILTVTENISLGNPRLIFSVELNNNLSKIKVEILHVKPVDSIL